EEYPLLAVRPRVNGENWMATVHADPRGERIVAVKGAPEEVIARATHWLDGETLAPLTATVRHQILEVNARVAAHGMRVLGLAFKETTADAPPSYEELTWVGLVALRDPVRAGVRDAILACRHAGIRPVILTGDQAHTAAAIGRELGLVAHGEPRVLEASALVDVEYATLRGLVRETDIFERCTPANKYEIEHAIP